MYFVSKQIVMDSEEMDNFLEEFIFHTTDGNVSFYDILVNKFGKTGLRMNRFSKECHIYCSKLCLLIKLVEAVM